MDNPNVHEFAVIRQPFDLFPELEPVHVRQDQVRMKRSQQGKSAFCRGSSSLQWVMAPVRFAVREGRKP